MIAALSGQVELLNPSLIILWVNGVGYEVNIPVNLNLKPHLSTTLFIHTHVKEDAIALYGFDTKEKLNLFKAFIQISGIGPKLALSILETNTPDAIRQAIEKNDVTFFTKVPGIGKKGAQKIILELSSNLSSTTPLAVLTSKYQPLIQALKTLGYKTSEIQPILPTLSLDDLKLEDQIKLVLKTLANNKKYVK